MHLRTSPDGMARVASVSNMHCMQSVQLRIESFALHDRMHRYAHCAEATQGRTTTAAQGGASGQRPTSRRLASFACRSCSTAQDFSSWRTTSSAMLHSTPTCMHREGIKFMSTDWSATGVMCRVHQQSSFSCMQQLHQRILSAGGRMLACTLHLVSVDLLGLRAAQAERPQAVAIR
jgi:hypothetical protein